MGGIRFDRVAVHALPLIRGMQHFIQWWAWAGERCGCQSRLVGGD